MEHFAKFHEANIASIINDDGALGRHGIGRLSLASSRHHESPDRDVEANGKEGKSKQPEEKGGI